MSDIVEQLVAASHDERLSTGALYREAADEIERLREEVGGLRTAVKLCVDGNRIGVFVCGDTVYRSPALRELEEQDDKT
jgi:hypothetical protein